MIVERLRVVRRAAIFSVLLVCGFSGAAPAGMTDYCQVPPYVIQNVPPTIQILLDTSMSMMNFAYFDGFHTPTVSTDDHACTSTDICTGYTNPGTYPTYKYYGYFDSDQWYTYSSNRFVPAGAKSGTRPASSWDGNFLNWLTMRRIDVVRKVMTGGKTTSGEGSGFDRLIGEQAGSTANGLYKRNISAADVTPYSGTKDFTFSTGSGTSSFTVSGVAGSFNVGIRVPTGVAGVLQNRVGAKARVGLSFFNASGYRGSFVNTAPNNLSLSSAINQMNLARPNSYTPLGSALWSVAGYFAQQATIPGYNSPANTGPAYPNPAKSYETNNLKDPLNYGTGGQPRMPVCAKAFVLLLTDGEPADDGSLPTAIADYANGRSSFNCQNGYPSPGTNTCLAASGTGYSFPSAVIPDTTGIGGNIAGLEDVALWMHTKDLRNAPTIGVDNIAGTQNLTLYVVQAFGKGQTQLKYAAINGGFIDSNGDGMPDSMGEWDTQNDNVVKPDTFYDATDGQELEDAIDAALTSMLRRASSGTAASVLASGEGSGANLLQAIFYPRRRFGNDVIAWTGSLQNLWYFVDPFFSNAEIREETTVDGKLNLSNDYIARFYYDAGSETTRVHRYSDSDGNGSADSYVGSVSFEAMASLWEAGRMLHARTPDSRTIYTQYDGNTLYDFVEGNQGTLSPYLAPGAGQTATEIIRYVRGYDDDNNNDNVVDNRNRTVSSGGIDNSVWKLGDVVDSTPRVVSGIQLNKYDTAYQDSTYAAFIQDNDYKNRGMAFVGGNDGMLHAFKMGKLVLNWTGQSTTEKAWLRNLDSASTGELGNERWGFIPKNALPYLKYMMDNDYCHLYYVDLAPYVFDASIGTGSADLSRTVRTQASWRTVLIGGMRFGGGSCASGTDCVRAATDNGYSSYFALDVTNPESPSLLWEFSNPALGFATTGPAIVRIHGFNTGSGSRDPSLNGEWYAVFGSGPTGPIDNASTQFLAKSNQTLKYFVVNVKTGALMQTIDTTIPFAFGGSMINTTADVNLDYQDDAVYVGFTKRAGTSPNYSWTNGGIGRIFTKNVTPSNSSGWEFSKIVDEVGPVTTAVARLQNNVYHNEWLYFGTGRFFYAQPPAGTNSSPEIDDADGQRRIVAIKEPCFTSSNMLNFTCSNPTVTFPTTADANFPNVTNVANVPSDTLANSAAFKGWFLNLDATGNYAYDNATSYYRAERIITDPLASTSGLVFFTSFKPYGQECGLGGKSFIWALRYNTGGAPAAAMIKGKALVQVSTASVEQVDMSTAFAPAAGEAADGLHKSGRRSFSIEGVPPTAQGLSLLLPPPPVNRILHMKER